MSAATKKTCDTCLGWGCAESRGEPADCTDCGGTGQRPCAVMLENGAVMWEGRMVVRVVYGDDALNAAIVEAVDRVMLARLRGAASTTATSA